jgi:hypothetical protein
MLFFKAVRLRRQWRQRLRQKTMQGRRRRKFHAVAECN